MRTQLLIICQSSKYHWPFQRLTGLFFDALFLFYFIVFFLGNLIPRIFWILIYFSVMTQFVNSWFSEGFDNINCSVSVSLLIIFASLVKLLVGFFRKSPVFELYYQQSDSIHMCSQANKKYNSTKVNQIHEFYVVQRPKKKGILPPQEPSKDPIHYEDNNSDQPLPDYTSSLLL